MRTGLLICYVQSLHPVVFGQQIGPTLNAAKTIMYSFIISICTAIQYFQTCKPDRPGCDTEFQVSTQTRYLEYTGMFICAFGELTI